MKSALLFSGFVVLVFCFAQGQTTIQLGSGTASTSTTGASPVNIYYASSHLQIVYTAAELTAAGARAGRIQKLGFYIESAPSYNLPNFAIKLKHTAATDAATHDPGPFTTVFNAATYAPAAGGFHLLALSQPFLWNGQDNLLVDVCFDRVPGYSSSGTVRYYQALNSVRYIRSDSENTCGLPTSTNTNEKPQLQLEFAASLSNDAGIWSFDEPKNFCAGTHQIKTTIANFGSNALNSVRVNWSVNGTAQAPQNYAAPIPPSGQQGSTVSVTLGSFAFAARTTYQFKIWTSLPNGAADPFPANDTLTLTLGPGLSGSYTIGGANPDFNSFSLAAQALANFGVCGPATFNVRNGTYQEQVTLGSIPGSSAQNPVVFQSESGNAANAIWTFASSSDAANFTLHLQGAQWVTLKNLSLEASDNTYGRVLLLSGEASNNAFENNRIRGPLITYYSGNRQVLIYAGDPVLKENNTWKNNLLENSAYGFYFEGGYNLPYKNFRLENNRLSNFQAGGIYANYIQGIAILNNTLSTTSINTGKEGIHLSSFTGAGQISGNRIYGLNEGKGIYLYEVNASDTLPFLVANNFIHIGGQSTSFGIYSSYGNHQHFLYNSVNLTNTSGNSAAFYLYYGSNKRLQNNILSNKGGGLALQINASGTTVRSRYNDLYAIGSALASWNASSATLSDWQQQTMLDSFSISQDPLFVADTSFHVVQITLNGAALPDTRVATDIEGDPRNTSQPDIGADEFNPPSLDAGLIAVAPGAFPFAPGSQEVWAVLKNFGVDPITRITLQWMVNDTLQTPRNWTGTLNSKDTLHIKLGNASFALGKPYTLKAWGNMPNGMADPVAVNDTATKVNVYAGLGGVFTIGGSNPSFQRISDAVAILNAGGVYAPVTLNIRSGTYTEQFSLHEIPGAGPNAGVTFQSESGDSASVTITFNNATYDKLYVVELDNAKWVAFRKLGFRNGTGYYTRIFSLKGALQNIRLENLRLVGESTTSSGTDKAILYGDNLFIEEFTLKNNVFENGSYGIYWGGLYDRYSKKVVLESNTFLNSYVSAVFLRYMEDCRVEKNNIQTQSAYYNTIGINLFYWKGLGQIHSNRLARFRRGEGISMESFTGTAQNPILVYNNFVQAEGTEEFRGIDFRYNYFTYLLHNTARNLNVHNASKAFYAYSGRDNRLINNIFVNSGGGYAFEIGSAGIFAESDYNDLYATGDYLAFQTIKIANLADWQAASGLDAHSLSVDPRFTTDTTFAVTQIGLNKAGAPAGISTDMEGQPRDPQKPDIGADEFTPSAIDAGLEMLETLVFPFPVGEQPLVALIKNYGANPLQNLRIEWKVNGIAQPPRDWTGLLLSNDTARVTLGNVSFMLGQSYRILAWTTAPNGFLDPVPSNDTLSLDSLYAGLGGTYTIGGTAPHFTTFSAAITQLTRGGVHAPVFFMVRNGTYTEKLHLKTIPGSGPEKITVFQSESGDSSAVVLTFTSTDYNANYLMQLSGTSYTEFRKMTFRPGGTLYTRAVVLADGAHHIVFECNVLEGPSNNSYSDVNALVYSYNSIGDANRFASNRFQGGAFGIYIYGPYNSGNYATGLAADSNQFINQYYRAVYLSRISNLTMFSNRFTASVNAPGYTGIYWTDGEGESRISGNRISGLKDATGIYLVSIYTTEDKPVTVDNNFIHTWGTQNYHGLGLGSCTQVDVVFNSVHNTTTHAESKAFYNYYGSENRVLNNLFIHSGTGYAYYNYYTSGILKSNYNDLYSAGTNVGYWGGNVTNLAAWRTRTLFDSNSISVKPRFLSDSDLHLTDVALDKSAIPFARVQTDIDGEKRDPVKPDMGADEFYTSANDASVALISAPKTPFAATAQPIQVTLFNNGLDTLRTVEIRWLVNGIAQTPLTWTGALKSGQALDNLSVGVFPFRVDSSYSLAVYTHLPNGQPDEDPLNDTARVGNLYAALGGIYTIGGTAPDFPTFSKAVGALSKGGVVDAVAFKVRSGVYTEQLVLPFILGTNAEKTVTFESEEEDSARVTLQFTATNQTNFVLQWNGAHWLRFRNMTLEARDATYGRVLDIRGNAGNNRLEYCTLKTKTAASTDDRVAVVYSGAEVDSNNVFSGNTLVNGSYSFLLQGQNDANPDYGVQLLGNMLVDPYYTGVYLSYQEAPEVSANVLRTSSSYSSFRGLYMRYSKGSFRIRGNTLTGIKAGNGILIENSQGLQGADGLIANNFIQVGAGSNYSRGLYLYYCSLIKTYFNSVHQTSTRSDAIAFGSYQGSSIRLLNNLFANSGGGLTMDWQTGGINVSNFNNLYTSGAQLVKTEAKTYENLEGWRSEAGYDLNSFSILPPFTSPGDLHMVSSALNGAATPVPEVKMDIDGQTRDPQRPDIGADEFFPIVKNDAGVAEILSPNRQTPFGAGEREIRLAIKNHGADTLRTGTIQWQIDNIRQPAIAWNGILASGQSDTLTAGLFTFKAGIGHEILAYTELPNGQADLQASNDSAAVTGLFPALAGTYTIGGASPDFPSFSEAARSLNEGGILGAVTFDVRPGIYNEQVVLNRIRGAAQEKPVVFRPESSASVTWRFDQQKQTSNYLLLLDGAQFITFRDIQFRTNSPVYGTLVDLRKGAFNLQFLGNSFRSEGAAASPLVNAASSSPGGFVTWAGNRFENGGYGLYLAPGAAEPGQVIDGNEFVNQRNGGIYLRYQQGPIMRGNKIASQSAGNFYGIFVQNSGGGMRIEKNQINAASGSGIWLYDCRGNTSNRMLLANNFVHVAGAKSATGLYANYNEYLDIYYNSIHLTNSDPNSQCIQVSSSDHVNLVNNSFSNAGGGYAIYVPYPYGVDNMNFNNYYITGNKFGFWNYNTAVNLPAWKSLTGKDNQSVSADPLFVSDTDLHCFQPALDSAATPLAAVHDDIDGEARNAGYPDIGADEFSYILDDAGVTALLSPGSSCAAGAAMPVKIRIQNYSGLALGNFNVAYRINKGPAVVQNVGSLSIRPGANAEFTFTATANLSAPGNYFFDVYTLLPEDTHPGNDTLSVEVQNLVFPAAVGNMLPANSASGMNLPIAFSWSPSTGATQYDFYLWKSGTSFPAQPTASGLEDISFLYRSPSLDLGAVYQWQVSAKNPYCATDGPVQSFTLIDLPDLSVRKVQIPASAFSGQPIDLTWEVHNTGKGGTGSATWFDAIYLSADPFFTSEVDPLLASVPSLSALGPGQSYAHSATVRLPEGISGEYYLFARTDAYTRVQESDETNNAGLSLAPVNIALTPPPDLQVTGVVVPNNAFSGASIAISWKITNKGAGNTRSAGWTDYVYFSNSAVLDPSNATLLGKTTFSKALQPDSSYAQMLTAPLPEGISGVHYVHVLTDFFKQEYEHAAENNNAGVSTAINVILTPPSDLIVSSLEIPASVTNGASFRVKWTVGNQGGSDAKSPWKDVVYLSPNPTNLVLSETIVLGAQVRYQALTPGGSYPVSLNVKVPGQLAGPYYVYIHTDADQQVYEYNLDGNNTRRSEASINLLAADLSVSLVQYPSQGNSGDTLTVSWTLKNTGEGKLPAGYLTQTVWLSAQSAFNPGTAVQIGRDSQQVELESGAGLSKKLQLRLPNGIQGTYYLFVWADPNGQVFENGRTSNNRMTGAGPVTVKLSPWVDLDVLAMSYPATATAGQLIGMEYQVKNIGSRAASNESWRDRIYLSASALWNPASALLVREFIQDKPLGKDSVYSVTAQISLPATLKTGSYYLHVLTDAANQLFEYNGEGNNHLAGPLIEIQAQPPVDLAMVQVSAPLQANSGSQITVQWQVRNQAGTETTSPAWVDAIYLSSDTVYHPDTDLLLDTLLKYGPLGAGQTYAAQRIILLPPSLSGTYYLLTVADYSGLNNDSNRGNNHRVLRNPSGNVQPLQIALTPPTDLQITAINAASPGIAGQTVRAIWTVRNQGQGNTPVAAWSDRFFLSNDFELNASDLILGTKAHAGALPAGSAYTDTIDLFLPVHLNGNFILLASTDVNNAVYEHLGEANNLASSAISIAQPPPSDLQVLNVRMPDTALVGAPIAVAWTLHNTGLNPASGQMREAVYLSSDPVWDVGDALLGIRNAQINLGPGATLEHQLTAPLAKVAAGDFYVLLRTDILNNILESDESNNLAASENRIHASVQLLPIGETVQTAMPNATDLYYRIEIPPSLHGETMLLTLNGDTLNGANEMYLRFGDLPSLVLFDLAHGEAVSGRQEIIVPELTTGTYYLLIRGNTRSGSQQNIRLLAEILIFQIRKVQAAKGGNAGQITLRIDGSKFEPGMTFRLEGPNSNPITATAMWYVDRTRAFAAFDLRSHPPGFYHLTARKAGGATTALNNAFQIESGGSPLLLTNFTAPANTRPRQIVALQVDFSNGGNLDLLNPSVILSSLGGAPIAWTIQGLDEQKTELELFFAEKSGPPGILRPGSSGSVIVYARADAALFFTLINAEVK